MKEYKDYYLKPAHTDEYDLFLICFGHEGLMAYIDEVENEPLIKENEGTLLVDQLLVTGNGRNRFLLIPFKNGDLDLSETESIEPGEDYRKKSAEYIKKHLHLLENSILSDQEREHISKGKHI